MDFESILRSVLPSCDDFLVEFLNHKLGECLLSRCVHSPSTIASHLTPSFMEYGLVSSEDDAFILSRMIHASLIASKHIPNVSEECSDLFGQIHVNSIVEGQFTEDDIWYKAQVIEKSDESEMSVFVNYIDYGNTEWLHMERIRIQMEDEMTKQEEEKETKEKEKGPLKNMVESSFDDVKQIYVDEFGVETVDEDEYSMEHYSANYDFNIGEYFDSIEQEACREWFDPMYKRTLSDIHVSKLNLLGFDETTLLLENSSMTLIKGGRYGLIGANGSGKSTLLRRLANYDIPNIPRTTRIHYVSQDIWIPDDDPPSAWEYVLQKDIIGNELFKREKKLKKKLNDREINCDEFDTQMMHLHNLMNELDCLNREWRARKILHGLGFDDDKMNEKMNVLSGGWQVRANLASALFVDSDLLLLDEPTNHLDDMAVTWLMDYLIDLGDRTTVVIVSHDQMFLDGVVNRILWINAKKKIDCFRGNFTKFIRTTTMSQNSKKRRDTTHFIESTNKRNHRLEFPFADELDIPFIINLKNISFRYPEQESNVFENLSARISSTSRIGLIGRNGFGKSTLIKILTQQLVPQKGEVHVNSSCRIGVLSQNHMDDLDLRVTPFEHFEMKMRGVPLRDARRRIGRHLSMFGLTREVMDRRMIFLSGGQRSRVSLASLAWSRPHLIIMDEPTNHLDVECRKDLVEAVRCWNGALLIVSHEDDFLRETVDRFWLIPRKRGKIKVFDRLDQAKVGARVATAA